MNREEALALWAPQDSPWSRWVKAVPFAFMPEKIADVPSSAGASWRVPFSQETALLVELAGADGAEFGVALARSGYRPVPLYNACPYPIDIVGGASVPAAVEVLPIVRALAREAHALRDVALPVFAPPAFLLDAHRHGPACGPPAGWFDNRAMIREADVPTAAFLQGGGIRQVVVVQAKPDLASDLRAVLLAWQEGGLAISRQVLTQPWNPQISKVAKLSLLTRGLDALVRVFYPCNDDGTFGKYVKPSCG